MASTKNKPERLCDALSLEETGGAAIPTRRLSSPISSPAEIRRKRHTERKRASAPCLITSPHTLLSVTPPRGIPWRRGDIAIPPRSPVPDIIMPRSPQHTDNRNQGLSVFTEISPRSPARNRRRCSASAILEPIHEGLPANRRNSTPAALLTRCISEELSEFVEDEWPRDLSPDFIRSRRRRSLPEIPTYRASSPVIIESLYPTPRKNSLVSSTLGELVSQYELLSVRERVPEETSEDVTNNSVHTCTTNNNNNNNDIVTSNLSSSA
ncbi:uncharacterized protein [Amphiura filiformis]|uniref:uncharacterized protein n=1 Tax=Amphiura filiformis TaxID=82378 RepID=UPI003B21B6AF